MGAREYRVESERAIRSATTRTVLHSLGTALEWCKISSHQSFPAEAKLKVFNRAVFRPFSYRIAFPMYLSTFDQVLSESSPVHCWQALQVLKSSSCAPTIFSAHVF